MIYIHCRMCSLANTLANVDSEGRFDIESIFAIDVYMNEHATWGAGVETQENKKIFVPLSKKDENKK